MKKQMSIILICTLVLLLASCGINKDIGSGTAENPSESGSKNLTDQTETLSWADRLLAEMTLEEKIGQLFIIRPEALQTSLTPKQINDTKNYGVTSLNGQMQDVLKKYHIGGIVLFSKNISTPTQVTEFIQSIQQSSKVPMFIGVDEEGGSVSRIANSKAFDVPKTPDMKEIGASGDPHRAYETGLNIGSYLSRYGFNLDFAPVTDVNTNPDNIVIGKRAFGSDPRLVAEMVAEEIRGFHEANIMASAKHFPGHGDTKTDTHDGQVSVEKTWDDLLSCELIPFQKAIDSSVDMIMISHITTPNITSDGLPASLSYEMITGKLRGELKFYNVVITDSMSMGAITSIYSSEESAVKAVLAGVDIVLMPQDFIAAYDGVYNAVKSGVISEESINESVLRILKLKEQYLK